MFSINAEAGIDSNIYEIIVQNESEYDLDGFYFSVTFKAELNELYSDSFSCDSILHSNDEAHFQFQAEWKAIDYDISWNYQAAYENKSFPSNQNEGSKMASNNETSFSNGYGTPTTICAHTGCNKLIAPSGNTNCCVIHSNRCVQCGNYCDEDALYCLDCILEAAEIVGSRIN